MPSWPTGVQTTTITFGKGITVDGNVTSATLTITPIFSGTKAVKWATDSTPLLPFVVTATANAGAYGSVQIPVVDQAGWKDDGQHDYSLWAYKLEELPKYGTTVGVVRTKYVQPLTGQTTIDFDDISDGSVGLPASAPVVAVSSVAGLTGDVTADQLGAAGFASAALVPTFAAAKYAGHRLVTLGDSITIAGDQPEGTNPYVEANDSIWNTAAYLSNGALRFVRNAGVGGNTAAQMLARFDTDVTPYHPTIVTVLAGTNDFTAGVTDSDYRTTIKAIIAKIRGIGAIPVLLTSPPVNGFADSDRARIIRNGRWVTRYAAQEGIVCIDVFSLVVDPATSGAYLSGADQGDGIHPSVSSRILIGTALWNALGNLLPPAAGVLGSCSLDPTNMVRNPLFLGGTSGGFPTNWFAGDGPSSGTGTNSVIGDSVMPGGSALRLTLTGETGSYSVRIDVTTQAGGFNVGDRLLVTGAVNNQAPGASSKLAIAWNVDALNWSVTTAQGRGVHQFEAVVPAGATAFFVHCAGVGNNSTGTIDFGGIAVRNLTTETDIYPL